MSTYLKLFEDFLQKKDGRGRRLLYTAPVQETEANTETAVPVSADGDGSVVVLLNSPSSPSVAAACRKMEHSYVRNCVRIAGESVTGLTPARTILVRRPPQCSMCHLNPLEENELDEGNQATIPTYNETASKELMNECARIAKYVKNPNSEEDDWEARIDQMEWSSIQKSLFTQVVAILDNDHLGRLANVGRLNEAMQRRAIIDKSVQRMRMSLSSISWDARLTQWLHSLLMESLPPLYMAVYLDILQTLKNKLPTLMDKMLFGHPLNVNQELLAPVLKRKWEPLLSSMKQRKLNQNVVFVLLPSTPMNGPYSPRLQMFYQQLAAIAQTVHIALPMTGTFARQPLDLLAEQIVSLARVKIQEVRNENPNRSVVLIGFSAGAALALQAAMSENVSCIVCVGFAYNTLNGTRGAPDDRILDIKTPILFVIGQNSAKTSPEEMSLLREKMQSETSLVIVGSADESIRIPNSRRRIDNVTQSMVDTMVMDEIYEFIKKTLNNPPGPRVPIATSGGFNVQHFAKKTSLGSTDGSRMSVVPRKRKRDGTQYTQVGRPRTRPLVSKHSSAINCTPIAKFQPQPMSNNMNNDDLNLAIQSILGDTNDQDLSANSSSEAPKKIITNLELVGPSTKTTHMKTTGTINPLNQHLLAGGGSSTIGTKIKMIPSGHFVQLKAPLQSQSKVYTIKPTTIINNTTSVNAGIGSIVTTSPTASNGVTAVTSQQQIFTLKSPNGQTTQFVTAAASAGGQQKYTIVKNALAAGSTVQLSTAAAAASSSSSTPTNVDLSNIIDMPIVFADNDGNISETVAMSDVAKATAASTRKINNKDGGPVIINQQIIPAQAMNSGSDNTSATSIVLANKTAGNIQQSSATQSLTPKTTNKVVFINRNTMKPCSNIISRSNLAQHLPKYTKLMVTNSKNGNTTTTLLQATASTAGTSSSSVVTPLTSTVKQLKLQATTPTATPGIINVGGKQIQIINASSSMATVAAAGKGGEKPQIRNIVVKAAGLKQIPPHLKNQLLNRNLTVRKLVNLMPGHKVTTTNSIGGITSTTNAVAALTTSPTPLTVVTANENNSSSSSSSALPTATSGSSNANGSPATAIQTSPKIITLNPVKSNLSGTPMTIVSKNHLTTTSDASPH